MNRPVVQIGLLVLVTAFGIAGLLFVGGAWKWPSIVLATLPLPVGGLAILFRQAYLGYCDICDQHPTEI